MQDPAEQNRAGAGLEWESIFQAIGQPTLILDAGHNVIAANRAALEVTGTTEEQILGSKCFHHFHGSGHTCAPEGCPLQQMIETGRFETVEMEMEALGGHYLVSTTPVLDAEGKLEKIIHIATDVTEKKRAERERERLEEELRQAQKMEAVGRLAGGVAHDFNNMLSAILGYTDMVLTELGNNHPTIPDLMEIRSSAERATEITKQLLAFGRRQMLELRVLSLNDVIRDMERMLRRLIREDIQIRFELTPGLGHVRADFSQIQQILLNLVLNARDALPDGGWVTIRTSNADMSEDTLVRYLGVPPGRYVELSVQDDGTGMDAETKAHIFEPFFTTKARGKGTGLGLATVYGIVRQHGGHIGADSEPTRGTTFRIFLPRVEAEKSLSVRPSSGPADARPGETVLVVEDAEAVRRLAARILRRHGYLTLEARSARDALGLAAQHDGPIHLLLTDVVMPEQNGPELFSEMHQARPDLRVVYMSGYADESITRHGLDEEGIRFLHKPFTVSSLTQMVRMALD